ncbi:hypothetical protein LX32DRAFT_407652 [Colletotrichum zoysiae]|uniref:Uncharacterized protein n=1 Tax=Colletotrichum zoysiae TaxID=1216348 RepID=A0AAD9M4F4_9PEZI|nr:hypothetical protein LX32DRAFT_407652 [Colletotrichum zoysiae]
MRVMDGCRSCPVPLTLMSVRGGHAVRRFHTPSTERYQLSRGPRRRAQGAQCPIRAARIPDSTDRPGRHYNHRASWLAARTPQSSCSVNFPFERAGLHAVLQILSFFFSFKNRLMHVGVADPP